MREGYHVMEWAQMAARALEGGHMRAKELLRYLKPVIVLLLAARLGPALMAASQDVRGLHAV